MPTGTVKWFNEDEAGKDLFVHQSGVAADAQGGRARIVRH
jgi:cold shock CspA family protein